jgi:hypothetical protein
VGASKVAITQTYFKSWVDSIDYVNYEIVIEVNNTGGTAANIHSGDQSYTILGADGSVLETGNFTYSFPEVVAPGEFGYYIVGGVFGKGTKVADVGKLQPSLSFADADKTPTPWEISAVKVTQEDYGNGLQVSGLVKDADTADATMGMVGVVFFDANGQLIGGLYDNTGVMSIRAGQSKGFKTSYPGTAPMKPSTVKTWKAFGFDFSFF